MNDATNASPFSICTRTGSFGSCSQCAPAAANDALPSSVTRWPLRAGFGDAVTRRTGNPGVAVGRGNSVLVLVGDGPSVGVGVRANAADAKTPATISPIGMQRAQKLRPQMYRRSIGSPSDGHDLPRGMPY